MARQRGQAVDSGIGADIQNNLGASCRDFPARENFVFQKIRSKKIELALQHFVQIAAHLEAAMAQARKPLGAAAFGRQTPKRVDRPHLASADGKMPRIGNEKIFQRGHLRRKHGGVDPKLV
ncbi:MAG TPA: hypothetical protein VGC27_09955 [Rhizomicrobium sp.]